MSVGVTAFFPPPRSIEDGETLPLPRKGLHRRREYVRWVWLIGSVLSWARLGLGQRGVGGRVGGGGRDARSEKGGGGRGGSKSRLDGDCA